MKGIDDIFINEPDIIERHKSHGSAAATTAIIVEDELNEVEFVYFVFKRSQSLLQKDFHLPTEIPHLHSHLPFR